MDKHSLANEQVPYVSTGRLPSFDSVRELVSEAYEQFKTNTDGVASQRYPALATVSESLFGICFVDTKGQLCETGDAGHEHAIMSVSKPFVFALVCDALGADEVREKIGANSTGLPFDSITEIERSPDGRTNPMVNSGAIATTTLVPGSEIEAKWIFIRDGLSRFAGRSLSVNTDVYQSVTRGNLGNQAIARILQSRKRLYLDAVEATELYTRQCSLNVSAHDLAVMGATLADGGVNPLTKTRVISPSACRYTLAVMTTAGLYETSGDWLYDVGMPGKSGIGGGIVAVSPGKGALGVFAPPLDQAGNSVKGQLVAKFLSRRMGLDVFTSEPEL